MEMLYFGAKLIQMEVRGAWVAQLVKHLTLDFGSDHNFSVHDFEPCIRLCADSVQPV